MRRTDSRIVGNSQVEVAATGWAFNFRIRRQGTSRRRESCCKSRLDLGGG